MQKPVCKLCGEKHWSRESCASVGAAKEPRVEVCRSDDRRGAFVSAKEPEGAGPQSLTVEIIRKQARERKRRYLAKLKADPERYAEYLKRNRERRK